MKRFLAVAGLVAALGAVGVASVPVAEAQDYRTQRVRGERQPHMQNALQLLEQAENELKAASNDKGGNKRDALKHVQRAQKEVREGIRYDNRN
jgi:hypothetical protein